VAGGALAEAAVDIVADVSKFTPELQAKLQQAAARAAKAARSSFDEIEARARRAARAMADQLAAGATRAAAALRRIAPVSRSIDAVQNAASRLAGVLGPRIAGAADRAAAALRRIPLVGRGIDAVQHAASRLAGVLGPRISAAAGVARRGLDQMAAAAPGLLGRVSDAALRAGRTLAGALPAAAARAKAALSRIDTERFTRVVSSAVAAAGRIGSAFTAAAAKAKTALGSINVSGLASGARTFAGVFAVATGAVVGFGLKTAGALEQTQIAFTGLLGSAQKAQQFIGQLQQFAARTPFEFQGLSAAARQLLAIGKAAGISQQQILPTLGTIGDLAATIGAGQPEIDLVVRALGQMAGKGKTSSEELQQISEAFPGFSAVAAIASAKGISVAEAFKQIEAGSITGKEGIAAILKGMQNFQGAAGAMQRQSETLVGVFSTFKDTVSLSLTKAFTPLIPAVKGTLLRLVPIIDQSLGQIAPKISSTVAKLGPLLERLLPAVTPAIVAIFDGLSAAIGRIDAGQLQAAGNAMGSLLRSIAPLAPAITSLIGSGLKVLGPVIVALTPLIHVLALALAQLAASPVGAALGPLVAQFILIRAVTGRTGLAFRSLARPLLFIGRLIKDVFQVGPITAFGVRLLGLKGLMGKAFAGEAVAGFAGKLGRLGPLMARLGPLLTNPWTALAAVVGVAIALIVTKVKAVREVAVQIGHNLLQAGKDFGQFVASIAAAFKSGGLAGAARRAGTGIVAGFTTAFTDLRTRIPAMVHGIAGAVSGAVGGLAHAIPNLFHQVTGGLTAGMNQITATLPAKINALGDKIAAGVPGLADKISSFITAVIPKLAMLVPRMLAALADAISGGGGGGGAGGGGGGGAGGGGLGAAFGALITQVGGALLAQVPKLIPVLIRAGIQINLAFAQAILTGSVQLLAALAGLAGRLALALGGLLVTALAGLGSKIGAGLLALPGLIGRLLLFALTSALPWVLQGIGMILKQFALLPFRILGVLIGLGIILGALLIRALIVAGAAVIAGIGRLVSFFRALPGRAAAAASALGSLLSALGSRALHAMGSAISSAWAATLSFFRRLPGRASAAASALPGQLRSLGSRAMSGLRSAVSAGAGAVLSWFRGLPGRIASAASGVKNSLVSAGAAVMHGFIAGVRSAAGAIADAVTAPIRGAINKAKSILHIGSPSKVFHAIGVDVGRGFIKGVTSTKAKIDSVFKDLIADVVKAFRGRRTHIDDRLIARLKTANKRLDVLAAQRDTITARIKAANDKAAEVTQAAVDFASIAALGNIGGPLTGQGLADQLKDRLAQIQQFQRDVAALAKAGLNATTIGQIVGAGVAQGGQIAAALLEDRSVIASINATQKQINSTAKSLGLTAADAMFDSGRKAGLGFLTGLKDQQAAILKLMTSIAKAAASTVKKTLKIRSPSHLFHGLGVDTLAGFLRGLEQLTPRLQAALARAVNPPGLAALPARLQVALPTPAGAAAPTIQLPAPAPAAAPTVQVFLDGELVKPIAVRVVREHDRGLRRRAAAKGGAR
jgi:tape measure domain-containing protein